jgi:hypothetical protein
MLLQLTYGGQASLKDFRIDIRMLLLLLSERSRYTSIKFARRVAEGDVLNCGEEASVRWSTLRRNVFLLLSDIMTEMPHKAIRPLPQLRIDGHGNLLNATFPSATGNTPQTIKFRHASLNYTEVHNLGYHKIFHFLRAATRGQAVPGLKVHSSFYTSLYRIYKPISSMLAESTGDTWIALRDSLWRDWSTVHRNAQ